MKKNVIRIIVLVMSVAIIGGNTITSKAESLNQEEQIITIMSEQFGWKYKIINGKKYKRKYNIRTNKWLSDWILIK